jgi:hypothetical protein
VRRIAGLLARDRREDVNAIRTSCVVQPIFQYTPRASRHESATVDHARAEMADAGRAPDGNRWTRRGLRATAP